MDLLRLQPHTQPGRRRRGYSLIEILMTVLIIQIIAGMVVTNVSSVEASERADRAAQEIVVALRYARMLAMSTGQPAGVEFDTVANTARVWQGTSYTTAPNSQMAGGLYIINFATKRNVAGTDVLSVLLSNVTTNPYRCTYLTLGGTVNNGYVTLKYGTTTKTINIPLVGDPKIQ